MHLAAGTATLSVDPGATFRWLCAVAAAFAAASAVLVIGGSLGHPLEGAVASQVDTALEENLPTWFSSVLLAAGGAGGLLVARLARRDASRWTRHWLVLGILFFALSADETAQLHGRVPGPLRQGLADLGLGTAGSRIVAVLVVVAALAVLLVAYLPWLRALPATMRSTILGAGALYVGSALGLEVVNRGLEKLHARTGFIDGMLSVVEEFGEMVGAALFACALLAALVRPGAD